MTRTRSAYARLAAVWCARRSRRLSSRPPARVCRQSHPRVHIVGSARRSLRLSRDHSSTQAASGWCSSTFVRQECHQHPLRVTASGSRVRPVAAAERSGDPLEMVRRLGSYEVFATLDGQQLGPPLAFSVVKARIQPAIFEDVSTRLGLGGLVPEAPCFMQTAGAAWADVNGTASSTSSFPRQPAGQALHQPRQTRLRRRGRRPRCHRGRDHDLRRRLRRLRQRRPSTPSTSPATGPTCSTTTTAPAISGT